MPRAPTQFYHSQFTAHYDAMNSQQQQQHQHPQQQQQQHHQHQHPQLQPQPPQKKKHVCPTCDRAFTTSGHLARHSRVHTGERNHKCPFPGCETRCSRQDNLQQHYRIHLSPGSRRSSTRSAIARAMNNSLQPLSAPAVNRRASTSSSSPHSPSVPPPLSSPPALEPARYALWTPPDSPPALAQATLPATAHPPPDSVSSRSSSSPEIPYSPIAPHHHHHHHHHHPHHSSQIVSMSSQPINISGQNYSHYRSGTTTYQEQSQGAGFTYVHTTPISHSASTASPTANTHSIHGNSYSYSAPHYTDSHHHHNSHHPPSPPSNQVSSISSRHSISHISHPQQPSYPPSSHNNNNNNNNNTATHVHSDPPSPASSHSVSSQPGPTTPSSYSVFHDDAHSYQSSSMLMEHSADQPGLGSGHISPQGTLVHPGYSPTLPLPARFDSPPPTLPPIQDERVVRGDAHTRHGQMTPQPQQQPQQHHHHIPSPYIHNPGPLPHEYQYHHQGIGIGHNAWKPDGPLRGKTVGALVQ